jgi:hypothetical protein
MNKNMKMSKIFFDNGISLDGFFAGDNRSPSNPIGNNGPAIHNWMSNCRSNTIKPDNTFEIQTDEEMKTSARGRGPLFPIYSKTLQFAHILFLLRKAPVSR